MSGVEFDELILNADVLRNNFNESILQTIPYDSVKEIQIKPKGKWFDQAKAYY